MDHILDLERPQVYEAGLAFVAWGEPLLLKRGDCDYE